MKFEVKEIKELNSSVGIDELSQKFLAEGWELSEDGSFVKENKVITLLNEGESVPTKFDKELEKLDFNKFTPSNVSKIAKKHGVDFDDAVKWVKDAYMINVADKPTMALESINEGQFKGAEHKKIISDAITHLIKGINGLELAINYLKVNGQGGAIGAFKKANKFDELKKLVDFIDSKNESCVDEEDDEDKIDEAKRPFLNSPQMIPNTMMELWFAVHGKESDKYGDIAKKLDTLGVSMKAQNEVSSSAEKLRSKKAIDVSEVSNIISKIIKSNNINVKESEMDVDEAKTVKVNFDDDSEVTFSDGTTAVIDYDGGFKYQGKYFEPDWGDGSDIEGTMKKLQDEMNKTFKGKVKFVFENAITKDGQVYESFDKIYDKYAKKDYWDLASFIENKKAELKRFQEKGDKNALKYTESDIEKAIKDQNKTAMKNMYDQLKDAHERKDVPFLQERLRHDQKITLEFYTDITGIKLPKTSKAIRAMLADIYKVNESNDINENFNKTVKKYPKAAKLLSTWAGFSKVDEMMGNDDFITLLPKLEKAIIEAIKGGKNDGVYKCLSDKFLNGKWFDDDKQIVDRELEMIKKYGF